MQEVSSYWTQRDTTADESDSIETDAAWPRPPVPRFDKTKDSICKSARSCCGCVKLINQHFNKSILRNIVTQNLVLLYVCLV
jgi:hypothetical protein